MLRQPQTASRPVEKWLLALLIILLILLAPGCYQIGDLGADLRDGRDDDDDDDEDDDDDNDDDQGRTPIGYWVNVPVDCNAMTSVIYGLALCPSGGLSGTNRFNDKGTLNNKLWDGLYTVSEDTGSDEFEVTANIVVTDVVSGDQTNGTVKFKYDRAVDQLVLMESDGPFICSGLLLLRGAVASDADCLLQDTGDDDDGDTESE